MVADFQTWVVLTDPAAPVCGKPVARPVEESGNESGMLVRQDFRSLFSNRQASRQG